MRHRQPRWRVDLSPRKARLHEDCRPAMAPNEILSKYWMYDELFESLWICVLMIVDKFSRVGPGL